MERRGSTLLAIVGGLVVFGVAIRWVDANSPNGSRVRVAKDAQFLLGIRTDRVTVREVRDHIAAPGQLRARSGHRITILPAQTIPGMPPLPAPSLVSAPPGGRLPRVGEPVRTGQVLAQMHFVITGEALGFQTNQREELAKLGVAVRRNELMLATLRASKNADPRRLKGAEKSTEMLRQLLSRGQKRPLRPELEPGSTALRYSVRSPVDGVVAEVSVSSGDLVNSSQPLFSILDPSALWMEARVFERDLPRVVPFVRAHVMVETYPGERFSGTVVAIAPELDPATRAACVMIEVANESRRLQPGMIARAAIESGPARRVLTVPAASVLDAAGRAFVFVHVSPEAFVAREVALGIRDGDHVEVTLGLAAGERVVTRGAAELRSQL